MGVVIKWPFTGRAEGGSGEPWTIFPGPLDRGLLQRSGVHSELEMLRLTVLYPFWMQPDKVLVSLENQIKQTRADFARIAVS